MNKAEVKVAQLVTDTIDSRVLSDPQTPADEKLKWVNEGLKPEQPFKRRTKVLQPRSG